MQAKRLSLLLSILGLTTIGLVSCTSNPPPTSYYVLGLPIDPPAAREASFPHSLTVQKFDTQPPLLRRNVVWRADNKLGYYSYEKWADIPGRLFSYRLYRRAAASGLFEDINFGAGSGEMDLVLKGNLLAFEEITRPEGIFGRVEVEAELARDGYALWKGTIGKEAPVKGQGAQATTRAISQAAEQVISELLASVEQALRQAPANP